MSDTVATWNVNLRNKVLIVEFEHGTTTGRRLIRVDGKEVVKRDWMFKLVGKEAFNIGDLPCVINITAQGTTAYEYTLTVDGKTFEKFSKEQSKKLQIWETTIGGQEWRVVLDKQSMEVWANGEIVDSVGQFVDHGTFTHFELGSSSCRIATESSGKAKAGLTYTLFVNNTMVPSAIDEGQASSSS